jgi:signal recognition particle subunit SRP54
MASRILGMGDVISLVEKAQEHFDEKQAADLARKMRTASFDLEDFLSQMQQLKKMGPLRGLLELLPGVGSALKDVDIPESELKRTEAIILSMTPEERRNPGIIDGRRKLRIAKGSGTTPQHVNALLQQFEHAKKMMQGVMKLQDRVRAAGPDGQGTTSSITGAGLSAKERAKRLQRKLFEKRQRQQQLRRQKQRKKK